MKLAVFFTIVKFFASLYFADSYPGEESVIKKIENENITKPPNEKRMYRGLHLGNEMKILLISDPSTKQSNVSLVAGVGALNDFVGVQGLAHLTGYALITNDHCNSKFRGLNELIKTQYRGALNIPLTREHDQTFTMTVDSWYLEETLEKLAECLLEPHFLDSHCSMALDEALSMVERDFKDNSMYDHSRILQVEKMFFKEKNPFRNFFTGSRVTLFEKTPDSKSLLEKVKTFYRTWYSSNTMTLVVLGKEDLDELERMVVPLFKNIENRKAKKFNYDAEEKHPQGREQLGHKIYIIPLEKNQHILTLKFPIPDFNDEKYRTAPQTFVGDLILDEEPGSLSDLLKNNGLCHLINVKTKAAVGVAFFSISCSLTIYGLHKVDDVINLIFQFINLIKEEGVQEKIFNELRKRRYLLFYNGESIKEMTPASSFVENLAISMQNYPIEDILSYEFIKNEWDQPLIKKFLDHLTPRNMNVLIISLFVLTQVKCNMKNEKYYGTSYCSEKIPDGLIERWNSHEYIPEMKLLEPNEFLAENYDMYPEDPNEQEQRYPQILHESSIAEIWFKQGDTFGDPKLAVTFQIFSALPKHNAIIKVLWQIIIGEMSVLLQQTFRTALKAGFSWTFFPFFDNKIEVKLFGYSDKLPLFLERFLSSMIDFKMKFDEGITEILDEWVQIYEQKSKDHNFLIQWLTNRLLMRDFYDPDEIKIIKFFSDTKITPDVRKKFHRGLFQRVFVRGIIHGNCTKKKAMEIVDIFENSFKFSNPLLLQEILPSRTSKMAEGLHYIYQTFNADGNIYAYSFQFEFSDFRFDNIFNYVLGHLVFEVIQPLCEKLLSDLEHKKSPKKSTNCLLVEIGNVRTFSMELLSGRHPPYVDARVEHFLRDTCNTLNYLSKSDFERLKKIKEEKWLSLVSNLQNLTAEYFMAIAHRYYLFNRIEMILNELHSIKKADLLFFCRHPYKGVSYQYTYFLKMCGLDKSFLEIPQGATKIKNIQNFSNRCTLLPLVFVKEYSTQWAAENNISDHSSSLASISAGYIAEQNKKLNQSLPQPVQTTSAKSPMVVLKQAEIFENFLREADKRPENISPKIRHLEEASEENIDQKGELQERGSHKLQSISRNLTKEDRQVFHTSRTIAGNSPEMAKPKKKLSGRMRRRTKQTIQKKEDGKPEVSHQTPLADQKLLDKLSEIDERLEKLKQRLIDNPTIEEDMVEITDQGGEARQPMPQSSKTTSEKLEQTSINIPTMEQDVAKFTIQEREIHQLMPQSPQKTSGNMDERTENFVQTSTNNPTMREYMAEITDEVHQPMPQSSQETSKPIDEPIKKLEQTSIDNPTMKKDVTEITDQERKVYQLMPQSPQKTLENLTSVDAESELFPSIDSIRTPESFYIDPIEESELPWPFIIHKSFLSEFWFKQDSEFQCPNLEILFDIFCPISRLHPSNSVLVSIFASSLKSIMIKKYGYITEFGESKWKIDANHVDFKIEISISSVGDKMTTILEDLGIAIVDIENEVDDEVFMNEKLRSINYWTTLNSKVGSLHLNWCLKSIMSQNAWTMPDLIAAATTLKFGTWKKFLPKLYSAVFIRGLIIGNSDKENARRLVDIIERPFKLRTRGFLPLKILATRKVQLNEGTHFAYVFSEEPDIYKYWEYYKFESDNPLSNLTNVLSLLLKLMVEYSENHRIQDDKHYEILTEDTEGEFTIVIRAISKQSITYESMDAFVNNFIHRIHNSLRNLSPSQFAVYTKELKRKLSTNDETNAAELASLFWKEISQREYYFERREVMVDQLLFVTRMDMIDFFETFQESRRRRRLVIYSFPKMKKQDVLLEIPDGATEIVDFTAFQNTSTLLPLV